MESLNNNLPPSLNLNNTIQRPWKRHDISNYNVNILSEIIEGDSVKSKIIINVILLILLLITFKIMNPVFVQDKSGNNDFKKNLFFSLFIAVTGFAVSYFIK